MYLWTFDLSYAPWTCNNWTQELVFPSTHFVRRALKPPTPRGYLSTAISTRVLQLCVCVARRRRHAPAELKVAEFWPSPPRPDPAVRPGACLPRRLHHPSHSAAELPVASTRPELLSCTAPPLLPPWPRRRRLWRASRRPRRHSLAPAQPRRMCRSVALWPRVRGWWPRRGRRQSSTVCARSGVPPLLMSPRVECTCGFLHVLAWRACVIRWVLGRPCFMFLASLAHVFLPVVGCSGLPSVFVRCVLARCSCFCNGRV